MSADPQMIAQMLMQSGQQPQQQGGMQGAYSPVQGASDIVRRLMIAKLMGQGQQPQQLSYFPQQQPGIPGQIQPQSMNVQQGIPGVNS